jgi:hypothetical protein
VTEPLVASPKVAAGSTLNQATQKKEKEDTPKPEKDKEVGDAGPAPATTPDSTPTTPAADPKEATPSTTTPPASTTEPKGDSKADAPDTTATPPAPGLKKDAPPTTAPASTAAPNLAPRAPASAQPPSGAGEAAVGSSVTVKEEGGIPPKSKQLEADEQLWEPFLRMSSMGVPHEEVLARMEKAEIPLEVRMRYPGMPVRYSNPPAQDAKPRPCQVGPWVYQNMNCTKKCGGGTGIRTRSIKAHPYAGGAACPSLQEEVPCNEQSCRLTMLEGASGGSPIAWPMARNDLHRVRDGKPSTWSYTTPAWCEHTTFWVGLSFPEGALVSGLRVWKKHHKGKRKDCGIKDLEVVYTTQGEDVALKDRDFRRVDALTQGYEGKEPWEAKKVDRSMSKIFEEVTTYS